jgi:hypothetical protein
VNTVYVTSAWLVICSSILRVELCVVELRNNEYIEIDFIFLEAEVTLLRKIGPTVLEVSMERAQTSSHTVQF